MAIQQPNSTDLLNSPDHALSHRVFANDGAAPVKAIVVDAAGKVGLSVGDSPSAKLHLPAGGTTVGTGPFKLTTQASGLSTPEQGAFELIGNSLHFTNLAVRRTVVQAVQVITSDVTVGNTTTETTVFTVPHGAGYLTVGKMEEINLFGSFTSNMGVGANTLTVRLKYAGTTIATFVIPEASRSALDIEVHVLMTVRSIGAGTTSWQTHSDAKVDTETNAASVNALVSGLDSTAAEATTVTVQWSDAALGNTVTFEQGRAVSLDLNQ